MCIPWKSEENMKKMCASLLTFIGKVMLFQVMHYLRVQCFFLQKMGLMDIKRRRFQKYIPEWQNAPEKSVCLKKILTFTQGGPCRVETKIAFFNFHENAKSMRKWVNFCEISQNLVSRNFLFPRKFSQQTYENFVKTKNFAKVVAKTKNLKEFDSDPACMVYFYTV
jgi:hypothetical protein